MKSDNGNNEKRKDVLAEVERAKEVIIAQALKRRLDGITKRSNTEEIAKTLPEYNSDPGFARRLARITLGDFRRPGKI